MELTNSIRKTVASLGNAKNRVQERCFIAEGTKCVMDTLPFFSCRYLFATALWVEKYKNWLSNVNVIVVKAENGSVNGDDPVALDEEGYIIFNDDTKKGFSKTTFTATDDDGSTN